MHRMSTPSSRFGAASSRKSSPTCAPTRSMRSPTAQKRALIVSAATLHSASPSCVTPACGYDQITPVISQSSLDGFVALEDFDPRVVGAFDEGYLRAGADLGWLLEDFDGFRAQVLHGGCEILDDDTEVVVGVADVRAVACHRLGRTGTANEQIDSVQPHHQVHRAARIASADGLGAKHVAIKSLGRVQVAAHQVHMIEAKLHAVLPFDRAH